MCKLCKGLQIYKEERRLLIDKEGKLKTLHEYQEGRLWQASITKT
jgi:hypothetical protein